MEAVANALGLAEGQVAYAAATPGDTLVVGVEDENALAAAEVIDGAWPRVLATTSVAEGRGAMIKRRRRADGGGDDARIVLDGEVEARPARPYDYRSTARRAR